MIFRQLFDSVSGTYSYLLASRAGGEAMIIDPVLEKVDRYLQLIRELDLKLVKAVDTHLHADHITGLGALRDRTHCITVMGENTKADVVSMRLAEGDKLTIEGLALDVLYTPGHTDDSYSFLMRDRVFTGDTLLIRGTGRTDFQNGDARAQYNSLFGKLLRLPDETMVFPAHDYKGDTVSTIGEEKRYNPRLQVKSIDDYVALMAALNLPNPKMMDVAVPSNMKIGLAQQEIARRGWALSPAQAIALVGRPDVAFIDLREAGERQKHGSIPGSLHAPYGELQDNIGAGGILRELARVKRQAPGVLLRLRRALGHGGAGRAGRRPHRRAARRRRHRRLEARRRPARALAAIGLGKLRGVGEFAECRHPVVLDREDVQPFGVDRLTGLAQLPAFAAGHEDHIAGSMEVARREGNDVLQFADQPEEFTHAVLALADAEQRIILRPPDHFPSHLRRHRCDDGGDITAPERGVKVLHQSDISVAHDAPPWFDAQSYVAARSADASVKTNFSAKSG